MAALASVQLRAGSWRIQPPSKVSRHNMVDGTDSQREFSQDVEDNDSCRWFNAVPS
jgi:hypothetical protein